MAYNKANNEASELIEKVVYLNRVPLWLLLVMARVP